MKLPKGIKRMRASASKDVLDQALGLASSGGFNGFIRTTAPKGIKEAGVILYMDGRARIAVFQSPERSLYGSDALMEVKRISDNSSSTIRVEEFLAQNLDDVHTIVGKMKKAHIEATDIEKNLMGIDIEADEDLPKDRPGKDEKGGTGAKPSESAPVGAVRARTADRIARSQEAASKDDDDILKMLEKVGMSPQDEEEMDDDVNQYIAAFEDFLTRQKDDEVSAAAAPAERTLAVDVIIDEMLEAASDDPAMMEFIEAQRERIISKVGEDTSLSTEEKHDRLTEQQAALEHISVTFRDVMAASEREAEKRRERLKEMRDQGLEEEDFLEDEARQLEEDVERTSSLDSILGQVLATHRERLESAEDDLLDEEGETEVEPGEAPEDLDLEAAKEDFLKEMRSKIQTVAETNGAMPGAVEGAVQAVSGDLQGKVEELEHEKEALTEDRERLEDQTSELQHRLEDMEMDMAVEVEARLDDLEAKEAGLRARSEEYQEMETHLGDERKKVEKDLEHAKAELARVHELEEQLKEREGLISDREEELDGKNQEVEGLREHLEIEIAQRATELEELETQLKARESELVSKEEEISKAMEKLKSEREEGVESDLERVKEMEEELRKREEEYSSSIASMETVIDALRDELRLNIEKVENLEEQLKALRETEARVQELEDQLATASEGAGPGDLDKEELRKLLSYLDDLLSKLPEKEIESFSKTEYFELYGRILDRLGI